MGGMKSPGGRWNVGGVNGRNNLGITSEEMGGTGCSGRGDAVLMGRKESVGGGERVGGLG